MSFRLYHISEEAGIEVFSPRPSPQHYPQLRGEVVYAINEEMLHLYLLPRDCPRICCTAGRDTTDKDMGEWLSSAHTHMLVVDEAWRSRIASTILYCYEFDANDFELLDENAGYYVYYRETVPIALTTITDPLRALRDRSVEVVLLPSLKDVAEEIKQSSLRYSMIRMKNATG